MTSAWPRPIRGDHLDRVARAMESGPQSPGPNASRAWAFIKIARALKTRTRQNVIYRARAGQPLERKLSRANRINSTAWFPFREVPENEDQVRKTIQQTARTQR